MLPIRIIKQPFFIFALQILLFAHYVVSPLLNHNLLKELTNNFFIKKSENGVEIWCNINQFLFIN